MEPKISLSPSLSVRVVMNLVQLERSERAYHLLQCGGLRLDVEELEEDIEENIELEDIEEEPRSAWSLAIWKCPLCSLEIFVCESVVEDSYSLFIAFPQVKIPTSRSLGFHYHPQ